MLLKEEMRLPRFITYTRTFPPLALMGRLLLSVPVGGGCGLRVPSWRPSLDFLVTVLLSVPVVAAGFAFLLGDRLWIFW